MHSVLRELSTPADTRMLLLVADGLGGLPHPETGLTELETARTPNLDRLAVRSSCGLSTPVAPGITPGSGPGHLGLFGYDPLEVVVGRGVLSALGVGIELQRGDVAARINFATEENGVITDRRAGRIPTEEGRRLVEKLRQIRIPGVELILEAEMQYRAVVVFRGEGLSADLTDTDPQHTGVPALEVKPRSETAEARRGAEVANRFVVEARRILAQDHPANTVLLRGFDSLPHLPTLPELYGIRCAVVAHYPMYRGLARLVGMEVVQTGHTIAEEFETVGEIWGRYDFVFCHVKPTDSSGEDGAFERKVGVIEEIDRELPRLLGLKPDVFAFTGDHSTPATFRAHSWHPVPLLLHSRWARHDRWITKFGEAGCAQGSLGHIQARHILPLMLAHAQRLNKFGA